METQVKGAELQPRTRSGLLSMAGHPHVSTPFLESCPCSAYCFPLSLPELSHLLCVTLTASLPTLPYTCTCTHKHMYACTPMHTGMQCMYTPQFLSHSVGVSLWRLTRLKLGSD